MKHIKGLFAIIIVGITATALMACATRPTSVGEDETSVASAASEFQGEWSGRWQSVCKSASGRVDIDFDMLTDKKAIAHFEITNSPYPEFSKEAVWNDERSALITDVSTLYLLFTLKQDGTLRVDYKNRRSGDCGYMTLAQA